MLEFVVLTLFPDMVTDMLSHSILKRAITEGLVEVTTINIRDFSNNKHKQVDDKPFGGGAGMVLMAEPVMQAIEAAKQLLGDCSKVYLMSPRGERFHQGKAKALVKEKKMIFLCGHYEGIDERAITLGVDEEISLGDFIVTGGELPALTIIDAVSRLHQHVLQNDQSIQQESFENNLLEYPQYTRPQEIRGLAVPAVLLSGHHQHIDLWRQEESIRLTKAKRPDLYELFLKEKENI